MSDEHDATLPLEAGSGPGGPRPGYIGAYRILRELGRGGMGVVYEAEQQNPRRAVALKVIRGDARLDATQVRLFQREAQALARLKHPDIAGIYESGCTEDGAHFFAMELVRGETLDGWLKKENLGAPLAASRIDRRLALFCRICEAVAYAHQRGIIHRDLKPSNILVTPRDSSSSRNPEPGQDIKILDFGLARITDADLAGNTLVTALGEVYGTLAYMSPEQFRGNPDEIDTRTDVYALGVILHEMLAGSLPIEMTGKGLMEAARTVSEQPPKLLARGWLGEGRPDPDLQTIISTALEKSPARRYPSASALGEDVARFRASQPINARPPSISYQLRKMMGRHRASFGFASALAVLVAASAVGMSIMAVRLKAERDRAQREEMATEAINVFLLKTFEAADPIAGKGRDTTVLEAIRHVTAIIGPELKDQPYAEATVRRVIGAVYMRLGEYQEAEAMFRASVKVWKEHFGTSNPGLVASLNALGVLRAERGDPVEAERLYREALEVKRRHLPKPDVTEMGILANIADLARERGDPAEAERLQREVLAFDRRSQAEQPESVALDLNNLGNILRDQRRLGDSESALREALTLARACASPISSIVAGNLGETLLEADRLEEAGPLLREAVEKGAETLGEKNQLVAKARVKLAAWHLRQGQPAEAETLLQPALPILQATLGDKDPRTRRAQDLLVQARAALGRRGTPQHPAASGR